VVRHPHGEPSDLIRSVSRALRVLEAVGAAPRGLTVKQIARRCDLTTATTYHLVRTLAYEGYVIRREDGTYIVGLEIADRFRELTAAFRGPGDTMEALRRAATETGYSHYLGRFIGGQIVISCLAEGPQSPYVEDLVPGFDDGAHATALGKALLSTIPVSERRALLGEQGLRPFTSNTITDQGQLLYEINVSARMGVFTEEEQYRPDVCCAAVLLDQGRQGAIGLSSEAGRWPQLGRALVQQLATRAGDVS